MNGAPASRVKVEPARATDGGHARRDARDDALAGLVAPSAAPLVPATAVLVPPAVPVVVQVAPPPVLVPRPAEGDDDDRPEPEVELDRGAAMVSGAGASAPPPPAGVGPRLQRSSLPELWKAMTTQDKGEDGGWLVDDATEKLTGGQMRKTAFLKELRTEVHTAADEELSSVHLSAAGCPYLDQMLRRYNGRSAAEVERAVRRYAPEARGVKAAREYIPYVVGRLRRGIRKWIETRKIPDDLPSEEIQSLARAGGWIGAIAGLAGVAPPKDDEAEDGDVPEKDKDHEPKRKALGPSPGRVDGGALVRRLGPGAPLDGTTRARMEHTLGHSFAAVRVHADDDAADLNRDLAARAFTIGPHIALGGGAPAPGTIEGDALLAHELAHVIQQDGAVPAGDIPVGAHDDELERHADLVAAHALGQLHGGQRPAPARGLRAPRPGLALRRCGGDKPVPKPKPEVHSQRFDGDAALDDVAAGKATIQPGAASLQVTKVQQALVDLGYLDSAKVTGTLDPDTIAALKKFQAKAGVPDTAGKVESQTLDALKRAFDQFQPVRDLATDPGVAADKTKGTRALNATEQKAIEGTLNPQVEMETVTDPITGVTTTQVKEPTFVDDLGSGHTFEADLTTYLDAEVTSEWKAMAEGKAAARKDPSKIFDWSVLEAVGEAARHEVEAVFGNYKRGGEAKQGTVLFDRWDVEQQKIDASAAAGNAANERTAKWRIQKILNEDQGLKDLLKQHGALTTRSPEKDTIKKVQEALAKSREADLLELHKAWPGAAGGGKIFLQRFRTGDTMKDRVKLWKLFETVIHEYIHTLTDPDYATFADNLGDPSGHTLREGMTDVLTKIVWSNVKVTDDLRKKIEGSLYDDEKPVDIPPLGTYDETKQAEQVMAIVGARNVYAAYFLGKIELIGGKKP